MMMEPSGAYVAMFEKRYKVVTGSDTISSHTYVLNKDMFQLDHDYHLR